MAVPEGIVSYLLTCAIFTTIMLLRLAENPGLLFVFVFAVYSIIIIWIEHGYAEEKAREIHCICCSKNKKKNRKKRRQAAAKKCPMEPSSGYFG